MTEHIGYKKCRDNKIVMLEILGENNENRKGIFDKKYATYRCSKARVLEIYDMDNKMTISDNAVSIHDPSFEYRVGEIIEPKNGFKNDLKEACSSGIYYFLTEEPAKLWNYTPYNGEHKEWYDNGRIDIECTYKDGKINGTHKSYYYAGSDFNECPIYSECTYKDGKKDGLYISYHDNGKLRSECTYVDGKREGIRKYYDDDGMISVVSTYKNGIENGPYKQYYDNGQIELDHIYKDGELDGLCKEYYKNGQIKEECTFKCGELDGPYKAYYKNGQIEEECFYKNSDYYAPRRTCDGLYKSYFENGQIKEICTYKDGIIVGLYRRYYENGTVREECIYENGVIKIANRYAYYTEYPGRSVVKTEYEQNTNRIVE